MKANKHPPPPIATVPPCARGVLTQFMYKHCGGEQAQWGCFCRALDNTYIGGDAWANIIEACGRYDGHPNHPGSLDAVDDICSYVDFQRSVFPLQDPIPLPNAYMTDHPRCLKIDFDGGRNNPYLEIPPKAINWLQCPLPPPPRPTEISSAAKTGIWIGVLVLTLCALFYCCWSCCGKKGKSKRSKPTYGVALQSSNHTQSDSQPITSSNHTQSDSQPITSSNHAQSDSQPITSQVGDIVILFAPHHGQPDMQQRAVSSSSPNEPAAVIFENPEEPAPPYCPRPPSYAE